MFQRYIFDVCQTLNGLSMDEYAVLGASLCYLFQDRYRCFDPDISEPEYQRKILRNNCKKVTINPCHQFDNIKYHTCFCNYYDHQVNTLITISYALAAGNIPPQYGVKKISHRFSQCHNTIQTFKREMAEKEMAAFQAQQKLGR